jgi:hypothetical protein
VRIDCSLGGEQMLDLDLRLRASVNVKSILHTQPLGLYSKILVGNLFFHHNFLSPSPYLAYLNNSSDGQHKEPQHQHREQQCWEQQRCQPTTDPRVSFDDASSNASNHGQHGEYLASSTAPTAKR